MQDIIINYRIKQKLPLLDQAEIQAALQHVKSIYPNVISEFKRDSNIEESMKWSSRNIKGGHIKMFKQLEKEKACIGHWGACLMLQKHWSNVEQGVTRIKKATTMMLLQVQAFQKSNSLLILKLREIGANQTDETQRVSENPQGHSQNHQHSPNPYDEIYFGTEVGSTQNTTNAGENFANTDNMSSDHHCSISDENENHEESSTSDDSSTSSESSASSNSVSNSDTDQSDSVKENDGEKEQTVNINKELAASSNAKSRIQLKRVHTSSIMNDQETTTKQHKRIKITRQSALNRRVLRPRNNK
ncbi:hypothetical protein BDA99DRAFT_597491 [Phascolomyces articulosus]|uniref:Uncharacterized protein n=1 Tax=Phascolomyces articulosus TaxID=60185 RepID=A0AAD5JKZ1_9FUNG|nr:hypothetical protein BDA99DRAFT_597491 [Phascolomyces articulosus]